MLSENHVKEGGMMANVEAAPKQAEPVNQTPPTRTLAVSLLNSIISYNACFFYLLKNMKN